MAFLRQWLLILFALGLGGEQIIAASGRENRAYAAAVAAFSDGMYGRAETAFAQFAEKYPKSERLAEAVLLQAQAEIKLGDFTNAVARLTRPDQLARAGSLADEYVFWTGEAQFQAARYAAAADTWIALAQKFPESRRRLEAVVNAAAAYQALAGWQQTVHLLEAPDGVFATAARAEPAGELVVRGKLILAAAKAALQDYTGAAAILDPLLAAPALPPALRWQGGLQLYQARLAANETGAALSVTTNLLALAQSENNVAWRAEGTALAANALEKLGRMDEALAGYQENLTNAPPERQREAVLKIAQLAIAQNQFPTATNALITFLGQFSNSPAVDVARLTLAELNLKSGVAPSMTSNQLAEVTAQFDQFIGAFTNSPLLDRAYLDRGWCNWLAARSALGAGDRQAADRKYSDSFDDFKTAARIIAARRLPPTEDLLVAWFKMGDAQFARGDYTNALENYRAVLDSLKLFPGTGATLGDLALYQSLRASLELRDMAGATNALAQILGHFPASPLAQGGALLIAESQTDLTQPENARALLEHFETTFPESPLHPQVKLAIARTYERQQAWPAAITNYTGWLDSFPTNDLRFQAAFSLAQAEFRAGDKTNAFAQFTNFVAQFPTNQLAPLAQWWVADYFYNAGDYVNAERNYKSVFQNANWQGAPAANRTNLYYPAQLMAGRAAVARLGYSDARDYFLKLEQDTNCPLDLRVEATFAHGDALMRSDSDDTNSPLANFGKATNDFFQVAQLYPTNELGALALFYIGDCNVQLANYDAATNAYTQVADSPFAGIDARSQARIGLGLALEKKAALASGADRNALLKMALDNYRDVFDTNLDHEANDFWIKKAGLQMLPLLGLPGLGNAADPDQFIDHMERLFPQSRDSLEKKRAALAAGKM